MKRKLLQTVLIVIGVCAISCSKDLGVDDAITTEAQTIDPEHLALIESMGLCTEGIIELEDDYIVEGDIALSKEAIKSYLSKPQTRQARWGHHVSSWAVKDIRVSTVALTNDSWKEALIEAMKAWNNIPNCPVYFRHVGNWAGEVNANMDSTISWALDEDTVAYANMPVGGVPGLGIRINPDYNYYTKERKIYVMVHELGHIIALGHTDYIANGEKVGSSDMRTSHIAGTPEEDDDSVMDSHSGGRYWGDWGWVGGYRRGRFTTGDMAAVQAKYGTPIWSSEITGPDTSWTISRPTFTLNHETNLVGPNVAWYVNNEVKQSGSSLSYTPASLPVGQVTIKAVVSYGGTNRTASKVITVSNPPAISGSDGPGLNTTVTYSVPTPPDGIIFAGWTVSGGSYTTTSGLANRILNIKFTAPAEYTLTANFTLPSGTPHSVQRVVVSHRPSAPVISTNVTTLPSGGIFTLTVNNYQSGITYKWYKYNRYAAQSSDSTITLDTSRPGSFSPLAEIMGGRIIVMQIYCEAVDSAGRVSDPSNTVTIAVGT